MSETRKRKLFFVEPSPQPVKTQKLDDGKKTEIKSDYDLLQRKYKRLKKKYFSLEKKFQILQEENKIIIKTQEEIKFFKADIFQQLDDFESKHQIITSKLKAKIQVDHEKMAVLIDPTHPKYTEVKEQITSELKNPIPEEPKQSFSTSSASSFSFDFSTNEVGLFTNLASKKPAQTEVDDFLVSDYDRQHYSSNT